MKTIIVATVRLAPNSDRAVRMIPIVSVYDRNSVVFARHLSRLSFDQYSSGQRVQSAAPIKELQIQHFFYFLYLASFNICINCTGEFDNSTGCI